MNSFRIAPAGINRCGLILDDLFFALSAVKSVQRREATRTTDMKLANFANSTKFRTTKKAYEKGNLANVTNFFQDCVNGCFGGLGVTRTLCANNK